MVSIYDAKEISEIRKTLGLSPTEFAAKLGVSASAVSYWERSRNSPKIEVHKKLSALLEEHEKSNGGEESAVPA